jgi:transcriptional regulator GlxA family with amidase domain
LRQSGESRRPKVDDMVVPGGLTGGGSRIGAVTPTRTLGLFLVPNFSMLAFVSSIDPLRAANRIAGRTLYDWRLFSQDGGGVTASNQVEVTVNAPFAEARQLDMALVCAGLEVERQDHTALMKTLRRLSAFGTALGAVCTGTHVLAKAGLLDGTRATIHWENRDALLADYPDLDISTELFRIDRKRYTCAGGTAAIDMMLAVIYEDHGADLAAAVTDMLIHHRTREPTESQRMNLRARLGIAHPKLLAIIELMERTTENPLTCAQLAEAGGLSTRQLERLFTKHFGHSPTRHYLAIRLKRARWLLRQTTLPILQVASSCGFASPSHFSKTYLDHFGCTPTADRKGVGARPKATASAATKREDDGEPPEPAVSDAPTEEV